MKKQNSIKALIFSGLLLSACNNSQTNSSYSSFSSNNLGSSTTSINNSNQTGNSSTGGSYSSSNSSSNGHSHSFVIENNDEVNHWLECACEEKSEIENHKFETAIDENDNEIEKCSVCNYVSGTWFANKAQLNDYAYSFAVVGDTQSLCRIYPQHMDTLYDWIIDNKDDKKIEYVFGLGDITDTWKKTSTAEWDVAKEAISQMDGVLPYSLTRGNHDENSYFNEYFGYEEYKNQFDGFYNDEINNSYRYFTIGQTNYLFLTLEYAPTDKELEWANEVIADHPNHKVIITTHGYLYDDGTPIGVHDTNVYSTSSVIDYDKTRVYNNGDQMWDKLVSRHSNILMIMSGHVVSDVLVSKNTGVHGNEVTQLLVNPQSMDADVEATGMVCMLYFNEKGDEVQVEYISTVKEQYYKQSNQFSFTLENRKCEKHEYIEKYDEVNHWLECECGYIHNKELHEYDEGKETNDGTILYTCECGHTKESSKTTDEVGLNLQELFDSYYNDGVYYKDTVINLDSSKLENEVSSYFTDGSSLLNRTTYYNADEYWIQDDGKYAGYGTNENNQLTKFDYSLDGIKSEEVVFNSSTNMEDYFLTLNDFRLGVHKINDNNLLKLDNWTFENNIYSSNDIGVIEGAIKFTAPFLSETFTTLTFSKVTVEIKENTLVMKLWVNDNDLLSGSAEKLGEEVVFSSATIGEYVLANLVGNNMVMKSLFQKADDQGLVKLVTPEISGYTSSNENITIDTNFDNNVLNIYYYPLSVYNENDVSLELSGEGTKVSPYLINNSADFSYFRNMVNDGDTFEGKYFKLTSSIDLNNQNLMVNDFAGVFDGNNCSIKGVNISNSDEETGLFKRLVYGGTIKNLSVYGQISGTTSVGGIAGNSYGTIDNCTNYTTITHTAKYAGGIVGRTTGVINNCDNYGNITSSSVDRKAGIAGLLNNWGTISGSNNFATIYGTNTAAGIAAEVYNSNIIIENSNNYGDIIATSYNVGGIVGLSSAVHITKCNNYGDVTSNSECVGGIGGTSNGLVSYCENYGTIKGNGRRAGIIGMLHGDVSYCINYGSVINNNSGWNVGGIAGEADAKILNCINNGDVNGLSTHIGGIVGSTSALVKDCINNGNVDGATWGSGGIAGNSLGDIINCTNNGNITSQSTTNYGPGQFGGIVGKAGGRIENCTNNGDVVGKNSSNVAGIVGNILVTESAYGQENKTILETTNTNTGTISSGKAIYGNYSS